MNNRLKLIQELENEILDIETRLMYGHSRAGDHDRAKEIRKQLRQLE